MGNSEEGKSSKPEKPPSPAPDQTNVHAYPDWAAMQAYYGPRVAVPPYFNSPGHAPHPYMWGPPQAMMPPYGAPYAAIYAHGGVYGHPGVHPGVTIAATPSSTETPGKSSGNSDRSLMKKLKGFDGLAMSIGNSNADSTEEEVNHVVSQSGETEGSSAGSDGNTEGAGENGRKRNHEGTPNGGDDKTETKHSAVPLGESNGASGKVKGPAITPLTIAKKVVGTPLSPGTALELRNPGADPKTSPSTSVPQRYAMIPNEAWVENDRDLKRERRKQSNRESARRSRLRKQAETEELAVKVESLIAENTTLKSELNRLTDNSEKLQHENTTLMEKLKNKQTEQNNGISNNGNKNSGAKLHQLLDASPRTDAVAAR